MLLYAEFPFCHQSTPADKAGIESVNDTLCVLQVETVESKNVSKIVHWCVITLENIVIKFRNALIAQAI